MSTIPWYEGDYIVGNLHDPLNFEDFGVKKEIIKIGNIRNVIINVYLQYWKHDLTNKILGSKKSLVQMRLEKTIVWNGHVKSTLNLTHLCSN